VASFSVCEVKGSFIERCHLALDQHSILGVFQDLVRTYIRYLLAFFVSVGNFNLSVF